ncbi:MAG: M48 family metallopeptidase [Bacteroidetes bacterium]|nr:M48 family metallopeptidase [Bacteroidota bacterium]HET6243550.1 M48 family metallopeptidase [Bacteroidia bacterium]
MKKKAIVATLFVFILIACSKVPISNRRQVNMLPESTLMSMSLTSYRDFLKQKVIVPKSDPQAQMIERVGTNIAKSVTTFLKRKKNTKRIKNFKWEFNLVNDPTVNAWCMPGGKVVFYTGILPITNDEAGIAVVMGHEIAHAVARHGNERMSQQLLVAAGGISLAIALNEKPKEARDIFLSSYGIGTTLGVLKYSRTHESEADKMGLVFMAMAGYNPEVAVGFWERMANQAKGAKPPEFISTHPSDERRIKDIKEFLPQAKKYYKVS